MADHLFPESTTYVHSYQPHEISFGTPKQHGSAEASIVEYLPPPLTKKLPAKAHHDQKYLPDSSYPTKEASKPKSDGQATTGNVDINDLTAEERAFFLSKTYRTTYDDYSKTVGLSAVSQAAMKQPFCRLDDQMLLVLNATKPDLAHYGFGLPKKCCVAWGTSQSRTLPSESRKGVDDVEKRKMSNPFPGYPQKMYPYIASGELSPHYDGSFAFGYTGHQRQFLEYPDNVDGILRKDFPKHVPRDLTTNQATLIYKSIPACEMKTETSNEPETK